MLLLSALACAPPVGSEVLPSLQGPVVEEPGTPRDTAIVGDTAPPDTDLDGDGYAGTASGGDDCDDESAEVHPGADEACGDDVDEDCDGTAAPCGGWGEVAVSTAAGAEFMRDSPERHSVAAFDLDGDGLDEVVVGVLDVQGAGTDAGGLFAFGGGVLAGRYTDADARYGRTGGADDDRAGYAAAGGDLDGDGGHDLVVTAYGESTAASSAGAAYVERSPAEGLASLATADTVVRGAGAQWHLGASVATGDVDGDGADEVLVSGAGASDGAGEAWLLGGASGELGEADAMAQLEGAAGEAFGYAVALGDTDGDGLEDLLVGSTLHDGSEPGSGGAFLWRGPVSGVVAAQDADAELSGDGPSSWVGNAVAVADFDGDGLAEVLVGGSSKNAAYVVSGAVSGVVSLDGVSTVVLRATARAADLGSAVTVGDFDGDGAADLAVGAYRWGEGQSGAVFVLCGPLAEGTYAPEDADANLFAEGGETGVGLTLATANVDGDAADDLLIGGYTAAWLVYGGLRP